MQLSSGLAGVEECEGPDERTCSTRPLQDERQGDKSDAVTLYVTVHSGDESKIVPLCFSPLGNTAQVGMLFNAQCNGVLLLFQILLSRAILTVILLPELVQSLANVTICSFAWPISTPIFT